MATRKEEVAVNVTGAQQGARDLDRLGRAVDNVGDELKDTAKDASHLDREMDRLQRTVNDLNREFARTGDKGLLSQLKDAKKELAPLQAVRKELDRVAAAEAKARREHEAGRKKAEADNIKRLTTPVGLFGGSGGMDLPINPTTLAVGGTAAAGLSLPIFAGAGGAILAAGGIGAAGLGVAGAAARNPAIGQAAQAALQDESKRWQDASRAFEEPTLRAIATIKAAVDDVPLEEMLKNAADFVGPLSDGLGGFITSFGEGFGELVEDAKPVIDVLRRELPRLGKSFESMFEEIGEGSEGGAEALEDILHVIERLVIGTGKVIHFFEDVYAAGVKLRDALPGDFWGDEEIHVDGFGQALGGAAGSMGDLAGATGDANEELETYEDILHRLLDLPLDLREANIQYQAALDDLTDSISENGRQWDIGTEAGRKNNDALNDAIKKAVDVRDAQIAMGVQSGVANKQLEDQIKKLRDQALAAGASKTEVDKLIGALMNFLSLPAQKVINVRVVESSGADTGGRGARPGTLPFLASGGPFNAGYAVVGEEGPELVKFDGPGRVFSHAESRAMAARLGGGGGGGTGSTVRHVIELRLNGRTIRELQLDEASNRGQSMSTFLGL